MDIVLTDGGAPIEDTTAFGPLSSLESTVDFAGGAAFTYDITVTTTTANASLTLTQGGTDGSFGGALLAGYLVTGDEGPALPGDTDGDGDGDVDDADLANSFSGFTGPLGPASVPEPASMVLLGLGGLMIARRRRG